MLKVGLVGIGFMGRGHLDVYKRLKKEGAPVKLVSICDIDEKKFAGKFIKGNIDVGTVDYDFSKYNLYTDLEEMITQEKMDYLDIALPTYLHAEATIMALEEGLHVLCEKPMALNKEECQEMIDASLTNDKKLMIAQCLRFWPHYQELKKYVESGEFGQVLAGYFYRGGGTPRWSYQNWLLNKDKSGGVLLDQHIHDVDMINWLFGKPESVSTIGRNVIEGSGYDIVTTNYIYRDKKVVNAQDDWVLQGDYGFNMRYRVNFAKGNLVFENNKLTVNPEKGDSFSPDLSEDNGYYREIKYFIDAILQEREITISDPVSTMETIVIAEKEKESADKNGQPVEVNNK